MPILGLLYGFLIACALTCDWNQVNTVDTFLIHQIFQLNVSGNVFEMYILASRFPMASCKVSVDVSTF